MWSRARARLVEDRVRVQNQIESLLEETQIKLSSVVSDLLGASGRRILEALAKGQRQPEQLADLADYRLRISRENLIEALRGNCGPAHQKHAAQALATLDPQALQRRKNHLLRQMRALDFQVHLQPITSGVAT